MNIKSLKEKVEKMSLKRKLILVFGVILFAWYLQYQSVVNEYEDKESEYESQISEYRSQISELESQVESKQEYIETVNNSIKEMESEVDRFEYENWRFVTPDVYSKAKDMALAINEEP